jgi:hypothetical protein
MKYVTAKRRWRVSRNRNTLGPQWPVSETGLTTLSGATVLQPFAQDQRRTGWQS